jgi:hypothetical protein
MDDVQPRPRDDRSEDGEDVPVREIALGRLSGKRDTPACVADAELRGVIRLAILTAERRSSGPSIQGDDR